MDKFQRIIQDISGTVKLKLTVPTKVIRQCMRRPSESPGHLLLTGLQLLNLRTLVGQEVSKRRYWTSRQKLAAAATAKFEDTKVMHVWFLCRGCLHRNRQRACLSCVCFCVV